ncbi:MAG: hypothetical protein RIS64_2595 [Bacteroidota bacterium]|jgi:hypothetical protein
MVLLPLIMVVWAVVDAPKKDRTFDGISCTQVRDLMKLLMGYSNKSIQRNYTISADKVTRQQVEEAQTLLDQLVDLTKSCFNIRQLSPMKRCVCKIYVSSIPMCSQKA